MRTDQYCFRNFYLGGLLLLTCWVGCKPERLPSRGDKAFDTDAEAHRQGLDPNELFLLDRNYPDYNVSANTYRNLLKKARLYDQQHAPSRNLDQPWTLQGPGNIGGRVNTIAVHPADEDIIFIGYSQGGLYRTTDGGQNWLPVFDDQPSQSIAQVVFDPADPNHLWVATGDVNISGYYWLGSGAYESHDLGLHWQYRGLEDRGILSKIAVDPFQPDIVYVGCMGFPGVKDHSKGFYRTTNGGSHWEQTLFIDDSTGIIDLAVDPIKPGRLFATAWTRIRSNTRGVTAGPGTGVYRSDDYGATWQNLTNDLPAGRHSRTGVEITNDGTVFISYVGDFEEGDCKGVTEDLRHIYTSFDSGLTWDTVPSSPDFGLPCGILGGFGWYFETLKVNPKNPLDMCVLGVGMYRTLDGGLSWFPAVPEWWQYDVHADKHDLVYTEDNIYLGTDGGAYKADLHQFQPWLDIENIPSTQFYRTTFNPHQPDWYYGGAQDNGTSGGNFDSPDSWLRFFGGDGFQPLFDPDEPLWMYAQTQYGNIWFKSTENFDFIPLISGLDGTRYWDMPLVMSSFNPKILFAGSDKVYKINMADTEQLWVPISPDLTRGDSILGGRYPAITAIAQSPLDSMRLYAGTQDGYLWTSPDGGENWINITAGTPGFLVTSITCSTLHPLGVFTTYSGYRENDHTPYLFQSQDAGENWFTVSSDLPMMGVNVMMIIPGTSDMEWVAGTDAGVYATFDAGASWHRVGNNMPYLPVYDLDINPVENTLIAATFARGIMTFPLDELEMESTSLEEESLPVLSDISVYPQPVQNEFRIKTATATFADQNVGCSLTDLSGKHYKSISLVKESSQIFRGKLDPSLPPGLYIGTLMIGKQMTSFKIVVAP